MNADNLSIEITQQSLYEMAHFGTSTTGLDEVIWIFVQNNTNSTSPIIKIFEGPKAIGNSFSVIIEDSPKVIGISFVDDTELERICQFININKHNLYCHQ